MNKQATTTLAALGLLFSTGVQADFLTPNEAPQSVIDYCVTQIGDHADYSEATRVRHEVETRQRRAVGHELRIDTRVFGDAGDELIREYATVCAVGNSQRPLTFRIKEVDTTTE